ncbi:GAF domain-containing protein [Actinoplanes sp. TFC3]|uniref:GAF domain-containing protein n=1 Tax=Actinoplanes sp. TFC3 TaxID=1710355 RepID=UPI00082D7C9B|nr:GAF domain-containing protein [Actinoplanes sp. TFC3]
MLNNLEELAGLDRLTAMAAYDLFDPELAAELQQICRRSAERLNMPFSAAQAVLDTATATLATNAGEADSLSPLGGSPNELTFCCQVVLDKAPYLCEDLARDPEWTAHPAVAAGLVRAYAGVPLVLPSGYTLGSHCVMAPDIRGFTDEDVRHLTAAATQIVDLISRYPHPGGR